MINEASTKHQHEPEIAPVIADDGHCRICRLLVEISNLRAALATARASERERCAKVCDDIGTDWGEDCQMMKVHAAEYLAAVIRALTDEQEGG